MPRLQPRHVEQILDQPIHPIRRAHDHLASLSSIVLGDAVVHAQERRLHADRPQRIAKVVGHDTQHLVSRRERLRRRLEEAGIVERQAEPHGDLLHERRVDLLVVLPGIRGHERERADERRVRLELNRDE
jgi:hypothetical protein